MLMSPGAEGQPRLVEHVTDGFTGLALAQDRGGFLWCGTNRGLFRYDGYAVEYLHSQESDPATLSSDQVNALALDAGGHLWVGTLTGLDRVDPLRRIVRRFALPGPHGEEARDVHVTSLCVDAEGVIWIGTQERGVLEARCSASGGRDTLLVREYRAQPNTIRSLSHNHVHDLWAGTRDGGVHLYVATSSGLSVLHTPSGTWEQFHHDPLVTTSLPHDEIWEIFEDRSGGIWLGTGSGVCRIVVDNEGNMSFARCLPAVRGPVFAIAEDLEGFLWCGTHGSEVIRYHPRTGSIRQQFLEREFNGRRYGNPVYAALCDAQGSVWFAVHYGLERFDPHRNPFMFTLLSPPPDRWVMEVTAFCQDRSGDLWVGTSARGLFRFSAGGGDTSNYTHRETKKGTLCSDEINAILEDRAGDLWIGTTVGLDRFDRTRNSFEHFSAPRSGEAGVSHVAGGCVYALLEGRDGGLWVATNGGLSRRDPHTGTFFHYLHRGEIHRMGSLVSAMLEPRTWSDGSLLLGAKGLYRFSPFTGVLRRYQHVPEPSGQLIDQIIHGIAEDQKGNLWVGTFSGVHVLGPDGSVRHFTAPGDLPTNLVCQIVEGPGNDLWLSTANAGLLRYVTARDTFRTYETNEGFLKNVYCFRGSYRARDGTLLFGSLNGFLSFRPEEVRDDQRVPVLHITDVQLFGQSIPHERLTEDTAGLVLSYAENMLTFGFVGLSYSAPEKLRYAYTLDGLVEPWLDCGTRRSATFTNLDPGRYVFRVRASNSDGVWNHDGASFAFVIKPPFWETWWFRGALVLLLGLLVYGAHQYRMGKIFALERLRLRIANDLHDDIGSDLSGIALESDLLAKRIPESDPARERFRAVGSAIRSAADNLRDVVWIVSPDQDRLNDLVTRLRESAEKLLSGIPHTFTTGESVTTGSLDMEFRRHILLMFKEILHNIVRHAGASRVEIRFELQKGHMRLCVWDNGRGFDTSVRHGGRGLRSLQARASSIGGTLTLVSNPGAGTEICLQADITRL
jgi:ligand-binding sensor domain-containing protein